MVTGTRGKGRMAKAIVDQEMMAPLRHGEAMGLAETELARMVAQLDSLSPEDWARPTVCELWDVRALASHVLGMAEAQASFRQFAHDRSEEHTSELQSLR